MLVATCWHFHFHSETDPHDLVNEWVLDNSLQAGMETQAKHSHMSPVIPYNHTTVNANC